MPSPSLIRLVEERLATAREVHSGHTVGQAAVCS